MIKGFVSKAKNFFITDDTTVNVESEVLINSNGLYLIRLQGVSTWSQGSQLQLDFGGNLEEGYRYSRLLCEIHNLNIFSPQFAKL